MWKCGRKGYFKRDESSVPPLPSLVNLEDTASGEAPCPSLNGYHTGGSTCSVLLLDKLLGILALLSSIPGSALLDWNKTPRCRLFALLEGWGKFPHWGCPRCCCGNWAVRVSMWLPRMSLGHILEARSSECRCVSQKCLPHDPLGLGKEIFNFYHILSKIRFPCNFSSVHSTLVMCIYLETNT